MTEYNLNEKLVYIGKIVSLDAIENADFILSATVVCGAGGKWRGIVKKGDFDVGRLCFVYMPDAVVPESELMSFMKSSNWRVKMRRFRGAPSEVVIRPCLSLYEVGRDMTEMCGVTRYCKPIPAHLNGCGKGSFPGFVPKTDEPNYQREDSGVSELIGRPFYVTEKCDGSSTTAYSYKGEFGLCSRNLELKSDPNNGYWKVAAKYDVLNRLPEGHAIQWETCGPGIQKNPMGLKEIDGFAFSGYKIDEHRYLTLTEFTRLCAEMKFPSVSILSVGDAFDSAGIETMGEGKYPNGKEREGVVVRSQDNLLCHRPVSFKVINLSYEK